MNWRNFKLIFAVGVLTCLGCSDDTSTPPAMDSSFVVDEGSPNDGDASSESRDSGSSDAGAVDQGQRTPDGETPDRDASTLVDSAVTDANTPRDSGVATDDASAGDFAVESDAELDAAVDTGVDAEPPIVGPTCEELEFIDLNRRAVRDGETFTFEGEVRGNNFRGTCTVRGTIGADAVLRLTVPVGGEWQFDTIGSGVDTDLYLRRDCLERDSEISCNDDVDFDAGLDFSRVFARLEAGDTVFIIVDSYNSVRRLPFRLTAQPTPAVFPPDLTTVTAYEDEAGARAAIVLRGTDRDGDVASLTYELYDADGGRIGRVSSARLDVVNSNPDGNFAAVFDVAYPEGERPASLRARTIDLQGQRSDWVEGDIAPAAPQAEGDVCNGSFLGCIDGHLCSDGVCQEASALRSCPDDWPVTPIELDALDMAILGGDNTGAPGLRAGRCGGGNATDVYSLTPPRSQSFQIDVNGDDLDADSILFVRRFCDFDAQPFDGELACNDDADDLDPNGPRPGGASSLRIDLEAGETVFIFVDSPGNLGVPVWSGPYRLSVQPAAPPTVSLGHIVRSDEDEITFYVEGEDIDFDAIELEFYDAAGALIPFNADRSSWPTRLRDTQIAQPLFETYGDLPQAPDDLRLRAARRAGIVAVDALGLRSAPLEIPFSQPRLREPDARCDPFGRVDRCRLDSDGCRETPTGYFCMPLDGQVRPDAGLPEEPDAGGSDEGLDAEAPQDGGQQDASDASLSGDAEVTDAGLPGDSQLGDGGDAGVLGDADPNAGDAGSPNDGAVDTDVQNDAEDSE